MKRLITISLLMAGLGCYAQAPIRASRVSTDTLKLSLITVEPSSPATGIKTYYWANHLRAKDSTAARWIGLGTGTANYLRKSTNAFGGFGNSLIRDDGTYVAIGTAPGTYNFQVAGTGYFSGALTIGSYTMPTSDGSSGYILRTNGSGTASWDALTTSLVYKGTWNANTNTPTLADGSGTAGWFYRCTTGDTINLGSGNIIFVTGDDAYYNGAIWERIPAGTGSLTNLSIVSANGFTGTVANPTTTPAITLKTSITGILKGNGTAISAATSGTDYSLGTSALNTGILKNTTGTGALTIAAAGDFPTLNQSTTGSAGSLKSTATTGLMTITGPGAGSTRLKTIRDANDTFLELGGSYTPTGTWNWATATVTWPTFNQNTTGTAAVASSVTLTTESVDPTCFPLIAQAATGNLAVETQANLKFDAFTGSLQSTSFNNVAITKPATGSTLTIIDGKTLTVQDNVTISGALGTGAYATIANYLPLAGGTMTGNLLFNDGIKSVFGSSGTSDSEIWYDGGNNWLEIRGGTAIKLRPISGALTATVDATGIDIQTGDTYKINGSTIIDNTAYASSWDGVTTIAPTKDAVYDKIESITGGVTYSTSVSLTSSQIKAYYTTPITLVSAPGSGYAIRILSCEAVFTYSAPTYSGSITVLVITATAGQAQYSFNDIGSATNWFKMGDQAQNSGDLSALVDNQPVQITCWDSNPTTGNGTLKIYATYKIITL